MDQCSSRLAHKKLSHEKATCEAWLEAEESFQPVILWVLREKGAHPTRYSRNFLFDKKISSLPNSLPILYIPLFPTNYKECFSERKP